MGMRLVSTVKSTTGGNSTNSGASESLISWNPAKKLNMVIFKKEVATLKDATHIGITRMNIPI